MFLTKTGNIVWNLFSIQNYMVNTFHRLPLIVAIKLRFLRFDTLILANTYLFYRTFNKVFSIC